MGKLGFLLHRSQIADNVAARSSQRRKRLVNQIETDAGGDLMATPSHHTGLATGSIGLSRILFQAITAMAPAAAVAFSLIIASAFAGGAAPLAVGIALVGCVFAALSMGQLAKHLP